jgi:Fe-S-cluster-containing hydrogenase component 2
MCIVVCPHAVFGMDNGKAHLEDRDACMECGACAMNCPVDAVSVKAVVGCAAAVINAALGRKNNSCCCVIEERGQSLQGLPTAPTAAKGPRCC